jgi:hypothetical protein
MTEKTDLWVRLLSLARLALAHLGPKPFQDEHRLVLAQEGQDLLGKVASPSGTGAVASGELRG